MGRSVVARIVAVVLMAGAILGTAARADAEAPEVDVYLQDVERVDYGGYQPGLYGDAVDINGTTYVRGLRGALGYDAGNDTWIEVDLGRRCTTLTATLGVDDESDVAGAVVWELWFDGEIAQTWTVHFGESQEVEVDVTDVLRMKVNAIQGADTTEAGVIAALGDPLMRCKSTNHVGRLAGNNRILTANATSQDSFPADDSASAVVLTRSDSYADALAGTPLALAKDAPLLLTASNSLDSATGNEIDRVLADGGTIYILGGTAAIGNSVAATLENRGYDTIRYAGENRFETAVKIASDGLSNPGTFLLANGLDFHDALVAGAASLAADNAAVLLTNWDVMPPETSSYLASNSGAATYAIGDWAVSAAPNATPVSGDTAIDTAVAVAQQFFASPTAVGIAGDSTFPDALTGGAHIGRLGGPLLWTDPSDVYYSLESYLESNADAVDVAYMYGGTAVISDAVASELRALI